MEHFFVEILINNFKNERFDFSRKSQMKITIVCNKMDMTYDSYEKKNMTAVEWKLIKIFNEEKSLINKSDRNWRHPLNGKIESSRV